MIQGEGVTPPLNLKSGNMDQLYDYTYSMMLAELGQCKTIELPDAKQSECGYGVTMKFWQKLREIWKEKLTYTDEEEINFFREVKPRFTCHIEYYLILNQGLLFVPDDLVETIKYWTEEEKRYDRFCKRHENFVKYFDNKWHYRDQDYFLQRNNRHAILPKERIYVDEDCRSSHDWIVRSYLANKMYFEFVKKRLEVLEHG